MFKRRYSIVAIGGATKDIMFYTDEGKIFATPDDFTHQKWTAFEYGAKVLLKRPFYTWGGGAANRAVGFARLGLKTAIIANCGNDADGRQIANNLKQEKVDISLMNFAPKAQTGYSFILTMREDKEHIAFAYRGANDYLEINQAKLKSIKTDWIAISSLSGKGWKKVLDNIFACHAQCKPGFFSCQPKISWNPGSKQLEAGAKGLKKYLAATDIMQLNKDEAIELALSVNADAKKINNIRYLLKELIKLGPKVVIITNGKKGAQVYANKQFYSSRAAGSLPIDTTGVGDAFGSGFLAGYIMSKGDIEKALRAGIENSGSVVKRLGAQNGLLKKSEILNLIEKDK